MKIETINAYDWGKMLFLQGHDWEKLGPPNLGEVPVTARIYNGYCRERRDLEEVLRGGRIES